jgi:hypothetical protein
MIYIHSILSILILRWSYNRSSLVIEETLSSDSLSKIAALKRSAIHFGMII